MRVRTIHITLSKNILIMDLKFQLMDKKCTNVLVTINVIFFFFFVISSIVESGPKLTRKHLLILGIIIVIFFSFIYVYVYVYYYNLLLRNYVVMCIE